MSSSMTNWRTTLYQAVIGQNRGHVIQRGERCAAIRSEQHRVVFRVGVRGPDKIVVEQHPHERENLLGTAGPAEKSENVGGSRPTFERVLMIRHDGKCLAHVLLMDSHHRAVRKRKAVKARDDDGGLFQKNSSMRRQRRASLRSSPTACTRHGEGQRHSRIAGLVFERLLATRVAIEVSRQHAGNVNSKPLLLRHARPHLEVRTETRLSPTPPVPGRAPCDMRRPDRSRFVRAEVAHLTTRHH